VGSADHSLLAQAASPISADALATLFAGAACAARVSLSCRSIFADIGISPAPADLAVFLHLHVFIACCDSFMHVAQALLQWRDAALPLQDYVTLPSSAIRLRSRSCRMDSLIFVMDSLTFLCCLALHLTFALCSAVHQSQSLPNHLVAFARNVDGDLLVLDSGAVREWSSGTGSGALVVCSCPLRINWAFIFASSGRVVAPSLWILLERLRDSILAGKCEMLDDCFVESS
jgi:hypothetical protein